MSDSITDIQYWILTKKVKNKNYFIPLKMDNKIPNDILRLTHNCFNKYGVRGFLNLGDAVNAAMFLTKLPWLDSLVIKILRVEQEHKIQRVILKNSVTTECTISNDQTQNDLTQIGTKTTSVGHSPSRG